MDKKKITNAQTPLREIIFCVCVCECKYVWSTDYHNHTVG